MVELFSKSCLTHLKNCLTPSEICLTPSEICLTHFENDLTQNLGHFHVCIRRKIEQMETLP